MTETTKSILNVLRDIRRAANPNMNSLTVNAQIDAAELSLEYGTPSNGELGVDAPTAEVLDWLHAGLVGMYHFSLSQRARAAGILLRWGAR